VIINNYQAMESESVGIVRLVRRIALRAAREAAPHCWGALVSITTRFSLRLKAARLRCGLTQMQLGVLAQIDEYSASARINQYERGKHLPDFNTAERLAAVLGVPTPFFYARDDMLAALLLAWGALTPGACADLLAVAESLQATPWNRQAALPAPAPPASHSPR